VASSLAMQLQISVDSLLLVQGPERFAGPLLRLLFSKLGAARSEKPTTPCL